LEEREQDEDLSQDARFKTQKLQQRNDFNDFQKSVRLLRISGVASEQEGIISLDFLIFIKRQTLGLSPLSSKRS
jgi:hypothetical protein